MAVIPSTVAAYIVDFDSLSNGWIVEGPGFYQFISGSKASAHALAANLNRAYQTGYADATVQQINELMESARS
jgi:hypothetical protein